jgi:hypothetical protein
MDNVTEIRFIHFVYEICGHTNHMDSSIWFHFLSFVQESLKLCRIWGFHSGGNEEYQIVDDYLVRESFVYRRVW